MNVPVLAQMFKAGEDHDIQLRWQPWGQEAIMVRPTELRGKPCETAFALLAAAQQPVELDLD